MPSAPGADQDFQSLVEAATDGIMVVSATGSILYANDAAGALFSQNPGDLVGVHFGFPMAHGQTVEVDVPTSDRLRTAEMRVSSVVWDDQPAFVTILRDVTERNALTAHLRDRLRFEELLLEISSIFAAATSTDEAEACRKVLAQLGEYLGIDHLCLIAHEPEGYRTIACVPQGCTACLPLLQADMIRFLDDSLAGGLPVQAASATAPESPIGRLLQRLGMAWVGLLPLRIGSEAFGALCLFNASRPASDGPTADLTQIRPIEAVLVDSLRRMRAETLLNTAVAKQAAVFQQAVEGLALVRQRRLVRVNQAVGKMFGFTPEEMVGMETRILFASQEAYESVGEMGYGTLARGRVYTAEHLLQRRTGERFWAELKGSYIDVDTSDPESIWIIRDISEQREDARRKEQLIEELRRSNAELERFAFITSHDLKEPVRMVASYVNLLSKRYANSLDHEGLEFMTYALEGARRIHQMIEGILEYARIDKAAKDVTSVSLNDILSRSLDDLADTIRESGARIQADPLPTLPGVPSEMERVFTNLLSNSIKFAKPNVPPRVRITVAKSDRDETLWHLTFSDNSIGIARQDHDKVFELFSRLHSRTDYEGNGLGLAIVKRIVERRGGRIWLESEEGRGTTFHIQLPG